MSEFTCRHAVRYAVFLIAGLIWSLSGYAAGVFNADAVAGAVAKVRVRESNGTLTWGSAVLLSYERLLTNCHVITAQENIRVYYAGQRRSAELDRQDRYHDLCVLRAAGVIGPTPVASGALAVGESVFAAGYPGGGELKITSGRIVALHDYDGGKVIQVSAPFAFGASGGGLFDEGGRLIGVLTFKARAGGNFYFAVPVAWVRAFERPDQAREPASLTPFWRLSYEKQPTFLRAVSLEVNEKWEALAELGEKWTKESPLEPAAWAALGTALHHLKWSDEAQVTLEEADRLELELEQKRIAVN